MTSALDMPEIMSYIYSKSWKLQFSASSSIIIIEDYYLQTFLHSLVYRNSDGTYNRNIAVPFWVAIETLTFGEILRLLHYLQDDVLKDVLNDFNLPLSKRAPFLNMIDILLCLRNNCAHTTLLNRFRTEKRYRINALLIASFSLTP